MIKNISRIIIAILMMIPNLGTSQINLNSKHTPSYYLHAVCDTTNNSNIIPYIHHWIKFLYTEEPSERKNRQRTGTHRYPEHHPGAGNSKQPASVSSFRIATGQ